MELEFRITSKVIFPEDCKRKEIIIEIYDMDFCGKNDEYLKVGQINGWYYNAFSFEKNNYRLVNKNKKVLKDATITEMLIYVDEIDGDEFEILEAITDEDLINNLFKKGLHNFINIDRFYIFKKYRNKGYATQILETLFSDEFITEALGLEPKNTIFGLIANPFELEKEDYDLDLSLENMGFLGEDDRKRLIEFYIANGFSQTKLNSNVLYFLFY